MSNEAYQVTLDGTVTWDLIFHYDNFDTDDIIRKQLTVVTLESVEYTAFKQDFNGTVREKLQDRAGTGSNAGASYDVVSVKLSDGIIGMSPEIVSTLQATASASFKSDHSKATTHKHEVSISPNQRVSLYQQHFFAPGGVNVLGSVLSNELHPQRTVAIQYEVRPIRYVSGIKVRYGDAWHEAPQDRVIEYIQQNDDINADYGGKYVWLVPNYTFNPSDAATRFDLIVQRGALSGLDDLAKGAGGDFRYLKAVPDAKNASKIMALKLYRSNGPVWTFPAMYAGCTGDINVNRGKTYLYLMWSTNVV